MPCYWSKYGGKKNLKKDPAIWFSYALKPEMKQIPASYEQTIFQLSQPEMLSLNISSVGPRSQYYLFMKLCEHSWETFI